MALILKDRVKETSTTAGTGTYSLGGAETGFETFSNIGDGNTTYYCCTDGTNFEIGIGTYASSGNTLTRTTILQSSNSDAAFSWEGGVRVLFCTQPAEKAVFLDTAGNISSGGVLAISANNKLQFRDTGLFINSSANGQLDIVADIEVQIVAPTVDINGAVDVSGAVNVSGAATVVALTATGLVTAGAKIDLNGTELILDADADTSITADTDDQIDIRVAGADQITIKDGAMSPVTDSDIDLGTTSLRYKDAFIDTVTTTGNVTVGGDLTVTGDDIIMGTNTAGHILVADGTNFNPVAVTDLAAITSVADGDTLLAVDASGGGLKKIAKSALVAGLATSSALTEIVQDDSPQLGANLDTNSFNILIDDAHFIGDESGNEQLVFQTTGSAVNQFEMTNAATDDGSTFLQGPILQATGGDSNIDLNLIAKGTGVIAVRGNSASGAVQFNCESNSHGQIVQGQPHSAGVTNTMLLPAGANSTLVSLVSADTLTNKTLTTPTLTGTSVVASLDISGDIDVDGTTNLDVVDIDGAVNIAAATTIATNNKIIFRDAAIHISSTADGDLSIAADDEIDLTSTLIDINGNVEISGTVAAADAITMATNKKVVFRDAALFINSSADGQLDLVADTEIELTATTVDVVGNFTNSGTIVSTGKITSDAGVDIDNFNIDGTTIALSSGDMTVDVAGDLILDAGGGDFKFGVGDTEILRITNSSSDVIIRPVVDAKDIIFQQRDGTAVMTVEDDISLTVNNDVFVTGRATGTQTADNDGNFDLRVSNFWTFTPDGDDTITLSNPAVGQSGIIYLDNSGGHDLSAHASIAINADVLSALDTAGKYMLSYYCTATSGNDTILMSATGALA